MTEAELMIGERRFRNYIGGTYRDSPETFVVRSPFYDSDVRVPESSEGDVRDALFQARAAAHDTSEIPYAQRLGILRWAGDRIGFSDRELEYAVEMLGMPLTAMREKAGFIGKMLMGLPQIYEHTDIEGRKPYGIVLACTPGNDISASTFVLANMVLTGSTGVIRPSSSEVHFTTKVAEILTESGYPAGALNVVNYGRGRDTLTQILGNNTDLKIIFGDDSTVSRFKEFGGKVIGYGAGRALAIVDESADPEKTADMLVEGSMVYPIGCNKTMGVRLPRSMLADIQRRVIARVDALTVGDPRNLDTRVGYVDKTMLTCMLDRIEHLRDLEVIEIARQGRRISDMQATPFVIISDPTSEFMTQEFPNYVLAFCPNGDLAEAVTQTEYVRSAKDLPKHLVISIFGDEHKQEVLAARERLLYRTAHSVHLNMPTNHIDPRSHQNISLPHELSRASVHALVA